MKLFKRLLSLMALTLFVSTFGCNTNKDQTTEDVQDVTDVDDQSDTSELIEEEEPVEEEWSLQPTHVFFYTSAVVNEDGTLDCYMTEDGEWCGIFRYFLADTATWTGLDDYANVCHVVHKIRPEHVRNNSDASVFIEAGDWYGWTMDAQDTFYGISDSCSDIPNDHKTKILVGQFANKDYSFGFGPATGEHLENFQDYIEELISDGNDVPAWDDYWGPNIISNSVIAGGTTSLTRPNYGFAFQLDSTGAPIIIDDSLLFIEMQDADSLVSGYYRSKTWWGYPVDDYIPVE
jgi:hypothetical protein